MTKLLSFLLLLTTVAPVSSNPPAGEALYSFADGLTRSLYSNDNDCTSSWGISMMLDLLRPGIGGVATTDEQLCDIVGLCGPTDELLWEDITTALTSKYSGGCLQEITGNQQCWSGLRPILQVANSIWLDDGTTTLSMDYQSIVDEFLQTIDFSSQDAGATVNEWVETNTQGLIDSILPEGPIPYTLVAVNTIFLNASWVHPFQESRTTADMFYMDETTPIPAHFMHQVTDDFEYSHTALPGYQLLRLPYNRATNDGTVDLSMILVLPLLDESLTWNDQALDTELLRALRFQDVQPTLSNLETAEVAVALPKFQFDAEYADSLKQALQERGLTAPFSEQEGFCGITNDGVCLFIGEIVQKTTIEVHEKGTIAAAATAGLMATSAALPQQAHLFLADRPFKFYIYDSAEDLLLFEGLVGAAELPPNAPDAPWQDVSHSQPNFWVDHMYTDGPPLVHTRTEVPPLTPDTIVATSTNGNGDEESTNGNIMDGDPSDPSTTTNGDPTDPSTSSNGSDGDSSENGNNNNINLQASGGALVLGVSWVLAACGCVLSTALVLVL